ncbi:MAG: hypothetical protein RLP44_01500 [Aggregatilineales bacterium]
MINHIIGIHTYGSHRVKHPQTKQTISAYKIGYTSAASAVLLELYGDQARDVSSKQASYHYIQIDAEVTIRHGYILLKITDEELAQAETITRKVHRPAVYRWQKNGWHEFPSLNQPDYAPIIGRSGPDFNPTGMLIVSASSGEAEAAINGITIEKSQRDPNEKAWHWLRGDTYPHRDLLKRWGCRWSKKRKAWFYIGNDLPDAVETLIDKINAKSANEQPQSEMSDDEFEPCSVEEASAILGVPIRELEPTNDIVAQPETAEIVEELADDAPKIRIIKPNFDMSDGEADAVTTAIRHTKVESLPIVQKSSGLSSNRRNLAQIPQSPCGELTGSITGNVWCYGFAIHDGVCVYVNLGGPRMAVEAIRARLSKGEIVNCVPWDAPGIELTAGEGNTGMYSAFMQNIPEAKFTSLILLHEMVTQPNYGGKSTTFIFHMSDEQAMAQLRDHITKLVKVPVFPEWTGYLWQAGQAAMLLRPTRTGGDVKMWTVDLDADAWTRLITGGLAQNVVLLPKHIQFGQ